MTSCRYDPQVQHGALGMFHCPDCGIMVLSGYPHPDDEACRFQLSEWEPPDYTEDAR